MKKKTYPRKFVSLKVTFERSCQFNNLKALTTIEISKWQKFMALTL